MPTKTKPKTRRKAPEFTVSWSGKGGASLPVEIFNPGEAAVLMVTARDLQRENEEPQLGEVYINRVAELLEGKAIRQCLVASEAGFEVTSCSTATAPLAGSEPGAYSLTFSVDGKDLPPLVFTYNRRGVFPRKE